MKRWMILSTTAVTTAILMAAAPPASAQQPQPQSKPDCNANTPAKLEGQVVSVDPNAGKITVRGVDGKTHEFQATKEMLQTMKPGDRLEATLRQPAKC